LPDGSRTFVEVKSTAMPSAETVRVSHTGRAPECCALLVADQIPSGSAEI